MISDQGPDQILDAESYVSTLADGCVKLRSTADSKTEVCTIEKSPKILFLLQNMDNIIKGTLNVLAYTPQGWCRLTGREGPGPTNF